MGARTGRIVATVLLAMALAGLVGCSDPDTPIVATGPTLDELAAGTWATYPAPPPPLQFPEATVPAGDGVVAGRFQVPSMGPLAGAAVPTLARYDTRTHAWTELADPPAIGALPVLVWSDAELFVLGGYDGRQARRDVHVWSPGDGWSTAAEAPFDVGAAAWTGSALVAADVGSGKVARLDEHTGRWRSMPAVPASSPQARTQVVPAPDGSLWVFRTFDRLEPGSFARVTEGFHLLDGRWRPLGAAERTAVGIAITADGPVGGRGDLCPAAASGCAPPIEATGVTYDSETGWVAHAARDPGPNWAGWTGRLVVFDSAGVIVGEDTQPPPVAWDPATDAWAVLPDPPGPISRLVWAGDRLVGLAESGTFELVPAGAGA